MRLPKIPLQIPPGILQNTKMVFWGYFSGIFRGSFSISLRREHSDVGLVFFSFYGVFCSVAGSWVLKENGHIREVSVQTYTLWRGTASSVLWSFERFPQSRSPSLPTLPLPLPPPVRPFCDAPGEGGPGVGEWRRVGRRRGGGGGPSKRHLGPDPHLGGTRMKLIAEGCVLAAALWLALKAKACGAAFHGSGLLALLAKCNWLLACGWDGASCSQRTAWIATSSMMQIDATEIHVPHMQSQGKCIERICYCLQGSSR